MAGKQGNVPVLMSATKEQAGMLSALYCACFATAWSAKDMAAYAVDPACVMISANSGGEPLGYILCQCAGDEADVLTLAVVPTARRQGIGRALITRAADQLAKSGVKRIFLEVGCKNDAALGLYRGLGFSQVGDRAGYYGRTGEDALVLRLKNIIDLASVDAS